MTIAESLHGAFVGGWPSIGPLRVPRIVQRIVTRVVLRDEVLDREAQVGVRAVHGRDHVLGALHAGRLAGQRMVVEEVCRPRSRASRPGSRPGSRPRTRGV